MWLDELLPVSDGAIRVNDSAISRARPRAEHTEDRVTFKCCTLRF